MRWIGLCLAMAGLWAPAGAIAQSPVGHYRLRDGPDVASELVLRENGRFLYGLSAGALDEQSEGRWTYDGRTVHLTTDPKPKPPEFSSGNAESTNESPFRLKVTWPDGRGIAGIDLKVGFATGEPLVSYTQEYGWDLPREERRIPIWVDLALYMYGIPPKRFAIEAAKANALVFILTPNDFGSVDFQDLAISVEGRDLVMDRAGHSLRYTAVDD